MIEAPIPLQHLSKLDFVDHHSSFCSIHRNSPKKCSELGLNSSRGGALFLTRAAVAGLDLSHLSEHLVRENGKPTTSLEFAFNDFAFKVSRKVKFVGPLTQESETSLAVGRAIMSAFTFDSLDEAMLLCSMFQDEDSFAAVAATIVAETVGLHDWKKLLDA